MIDVRVGLGQDTHAFASERTKPLILGGVVIPGGPALAADSDGDLILHALVRAADTLLGSEYLGADAERLRAEGVTDSRAYLAPAPAHLAREGLRITQVAIALEGARPRLREHFAAIRASVAAIVSVPVARVGISAETGDGLTDCGRGAGLRAQVLLTVVGA
jgi:2-C-methyl-D-erythritol 2,4-cyclodiphosphate synthase